MSRAGRTAAGVLGAIVLLLVLAQLLLPRLAASRISSRLRPYGHVQSVSVSAWPAVKLLWGNADTVNVRVSDLAVSPAQTAKLLHEARGAQTLQMTAARARVGSLRMTAASLQKHGDSVSAHALVSATDAQAALPAGLSVQLLGSEGGRVRVRASGGLFGITASIDAVAGASEGKLVAHPEGLLLEGLQLTLFSDPHVRVEGVSASAVTVAGQPVAYRLGISARLR